MRNLEYSILGSTDEEVGWSDVGWIRNTETARFYREQQHQFYNPGHVVS